MATHASNQIAAVAAAKKNNFALRVIDHAAPPLQANHPKCGTDNGPILPLPNPLQKLFNPSGAAASSFVPGQTDC